MNFENRARGWRRRWLDIVWLITVGAITTFLPMPEWLRTVLAITLVLYVICAIALDVLERKVEE